MTTPRAPKADPTQRKRVRIHRGKEYQVSEAHPVADFYQWLGEDGIEALTESIRERGQDKPIHRLPDGRIIDGRNRELACLVAGVEPQYENRELANEAEIIAYIRDANNLRRHSSESQRAMTAARLANLKRGTNQYAPKVDGAQAPSISQSEVALQFHISRDLVKRALAVIRKGVTELAAAVDEGRLDVSTAAKVATLPAGMQQTISTAPDPKRAARNALCFCVRPPAPSEHSPLTPDGEVFIQISLDGPTVGSFDDGSGTVLPGIPQPLADGQVWMGWYVDPAKGFRTAYLIPGLSWGWYVVVLDIGSDEWKTYKYPLKPWAAMAKLTHPDCFGFDVEAASWQPTTRYAPAAVNPFFLDPDYAPNLPEDVTRFVEDQRREEEQKALPASSAGEEAMYHDIEF